MDDVKYVTRPVYPWISASLISCSRSWQGIRLPVIVAKIWRKWYTWCITPIVSYRHRPVWTEYVRNCQNVYWSSFFLPLSSPSCSPRQILYSISSIYIYIYLVIIITQYIEMTIITGNIRNYRVASCWNFVSPYINIRLEKRTIQKTPRKTEIKEKLNRKQNTQIRLFALMFSLPFFSHSGLLPKMFVSISCSSPSYSFYCHVSSFSI